MAYSGRQIAGFIPHHMRIFGLPLSSFIVLLVIPALIVLYQFYYCWQVYTRRRD